jgi:putative hemolysin
MTAPDRQLVDLAAALKKPWSKKLYSLIQTPFERMLAIDRINEYYQNACRVERDVNFFQKCLEGMRIQYRVSPEDLERIPTSGPVLAVANHPFGAVDGVVLGSLLLQVRPDVKVLGNYLLGAITELCPWLILVDPFGAEDSAKKNLRSMKETLNYLKEGGMVATFPAGEVSSFQWRNRQVADPQWNVNTARFIHKSQASVLPIFFEGRNTALFQMAGMIHPRLRTLLLPREMARREETVISVRIGSPIPYRKLAEFENDQMMTDYLRMKTYILRNRKDEENGKRKFFSLPRIKKTAEQEPLAAPVSTDLLLEDIERLGPNRVLASQGSFQVILGKMHEMPRIMREIGRLREKTFREVKEGTGRSIDLDPYDHYYYHLFLWDTSKQQVAGAYRLGQTDEILNMYGKQGLYTSTLFRFKSELLRKLNPGLEVGRSFIRSEYQKKHATLSLLWRGIGRFVTTHPRYKILFGPVSITQEYNRFSRDLMVQFLRTKKMDNKLARLVKAKRPPRKRRFKPDMKAQIRQFEDIDDVSAMVSEIETDQKGVPILLRHYLKLRGTLLGFNIDRDFSSVLDGLIMVDLTRTDRKLLSRYLGEDTDSFLQYHGVKLTEEDSNDLLQETSVE